MNIQNFVKQAEQIKKTYPNIWNEQFEKDLQNLNQIVETSKLDPKLAEMQFMQLSFYKFPTFGDYIQSTNIDFHKYKLTNTIIKEKRKKKCINCGCEEFIPMDGQYYCKKCKSLIGKKANNQLVVKDNVDISKHITKQLNILTGRIITPPSTIVGVFKYIKIWLKENKYIDSWVKYSKKFNNFKKIYLELTGQEWNITNENNFYNYKLFKLFCDEFYNLTILVKAYYKIKTNMDSLTQKEQLIIIHEFVKANKKYPSNNEMFNFNNYNYEVGKFVLRMTITDWNNETKFKQYINKIFNRDITLPGLMFNYPNIVNNKNQIPKKFIYQQNYIFIIKDVYNIQSIRISEVDKKTICDIIIKFNEYYKN